MCWLGFLYSTHKYHMVVKFLMGIANPTDSGTSSTIRDYCRIATLHGLAYFDLFWSSRILVYWLLTTILCLSMGTWLVASTFLSMESDPFVYQAEFGSTGVDEVQYPTLTLCTYQMYDKWNLARILLNRYDLRCLARNDCPLAATEAYAPFKELLDRPLTTKWLNEEYRTGMLGEYREQQGRYVRVMQNYPVDWKQFKGIVHRLETRPGGEWEILVPGGLESMDQLLSQRSVQEPRQVIRCILLEVQLQASFGQGGHLP